MFPKPVLDALEQLVDLPDEVFLCVNAHLITSSTRGQGTSVVSSAGHCEHSIHTHPRRRDSVYYSPSTYDVLLAWREKDWPCLNLIAYRDDSGRLAIKAYSIGNEAAWERHFRGLYDAQVLDVLREAHKRALLTGEAERAWERFLAVIGVRVTRVH